MLKTLIVDDHELVRALIRERIQQHIKVDVSCEAGSGEEAIRYAMRDKPELVLMELGLPGMGGLELVRRLKRLAPSPRIIVLSGHVDGALPRNVLALGVEGYLTKTGLPRDLFDAIDTVAAGKRYVDPRLACNLVLGGIDGNQGPLDTLTTRELEVLSHIARGAPVADIAQRMSRSTKTITTLRGRLHRKLNVRTDVEMTLLAMRHGLFEPSRAF